jgi:hypothetical protein
MGLERLMAATASVGQLHYKHRVAQQGLQYSKHLTGLSIQLLHIASVCVCVDTQIGGYLKVLSHNL